MNNAISPEHTTVRGRHFHPLTLADQRMMQDFPRRVPQHFVGYTFETLAASAPIPYIVQSRVAPEFPLMAPGLADDYLHRPAHLCLL